MALDDIFDELGIDEPVVEVKKVQEPVVEKQEVVKEEPKRVMGDYVGISNDNPEYKDIDAENEEWNTDEYRRVARLFLGKKYEYKVHLGSQNQGYIFYISPPTFQEDLEISVRATELRRNVDDIRLMEITYKLALLDMVIRKIVRVKDGIKEVVSMRFLDMVEGNRNPTKVYQELVNPLFVRYVDIKGLVDADDSDIKK